MIWTIKLSPVEWLEMDYKERFDYDDSIKKWFERAKQMEFDIMDEFSIWLNKCWQRVPNSDKWVHDFQNSNERNLSELYKLFLKERNQYDR